MVYCTRCVMPSSKPDLQMDAGGVCSACRAFELRARVDWPAREKELRTILDHFRSPSYWDCIVPVSGGKDSTYQTVKMLEYGMHPLAVTSTTCHLSDLGRRNIENLKNLGVDHIGFSPDPKVRRQLNLIGLEMIGDISWPEHVGIFTIPVQVAVRYKVPLIVWGENSQNEYGGPVAAQASHVLTRRWLEEFGGLLGMRVSDLTALGLNEKDLLPYQYPSEEELVGVTGIFLGHFLPWDGYANAFFSTAHGFQTQQTTVEGSLANYENLDNLQTGIHDYFKFLKFGFGRTTDIACMHIRRGRLSRDDAWRLVRLHDGRFPWTYLGVQLADILQPLGITVDRFIEICDQFTNKQLFRCSGGQLVKDAKGNLQLALD